MATQVFDGSSTYRQRRGQLLTYFDRTALDAWTKLTSDAPVGSIRATVRAGRDRTRATFLSFLPVDLHGRRILDAGCGTGALALAMAARGAEVVAVDLSPRLIGLAQERAAQDGLQSRVAFAAGDMLDPALGRFDHVVAMDSLIHYRAADAVRAVEGLAGRTGASVLFTFAPRTPALSVMHAVGRLFPRGDRAPAIEPVRPARIRHLLASAPGLAGCTVGRSQRIATGFYIAEVQEVRAP